MNRFKTKTIEAIKLNKCLKYNILINTGCPRKNASEDPKNLEINFKTYYFVLSTMYVQNTFLQCLETHVHAYLCL